MIKFYMTPGSCTTGIHILLEEAELCFEVHLVNLLKGDQLNEAYLAINPKGTIPTLVLDDGTALTDFQSIAYWIAQSHPRYALLPQDITQSAKILEIMNYAVNTIHGEGFTRIFTPEKHIPQNNQEEIKAQGKRIVEQSFSIIDKQLKNNRYINETFSIADAALFYVEFWANKIGLQLPDNCSAHYKLMLTRPTVRQVLSEEGYRI